MARLLSLLLLLVALGTAPAVAETRIPLRPEMIVNESALGDASKLIDESAVSDPLNSPGGHPTRPFFPGWTATLYPIHIVIDLGIERHLTHLYLYNETGESPLVLETGPLNDRKTQNLKLSGYQAWVAFPLSTTTRYVRLTLTQPTSLPELALYADDNPPLPVTPQPKRRTVSVPTMDQFIGTNAFIDDPLDRLAVPVGFVREYHSWQWDTEGTDHQVRFQPSGAAGGNAWFFDDFYAHLAAAGVTVCPAIQQSSPVYFPGTDLDAKPVPAGKNPEAPESYRIHAGHLFQFAARYGATHVDDALLTLAPGQPRRSGLGTLRYIENWNEPDKTWRGREGRFTPYELAAMCSADYDGDQGRMGKTVGVRAADPKMRLVMGGLAGISLDYLRAMKLWADTHRNGDFPADAINLHHYSSDGTEEQAFKTTGISPEADHLREKMTAIVRWRNTYLPKCELWVTEFGYDTHPKSPLHAPAIGSYSAEEVQGIWLLRSYFALAAAGVDRAAMFMFRDVKSTDGGVFATCGLVTEKGQWTPKPSYYYLATLKKRLVGMRFAGEMATGVPGVLAYRFTGAAGKTAYALWCSTSEDRRGAAVSLRVPSKTVTRIDFSNGKTAGETTILMATQGKIQLEAREKPVLLLIP